MRKNFLVMVCCFLVASGNLFAKEYYIEGNVERKVKNGNSYYTLLDPIGHNIYFEPVQQIKAGRYKDGSLGFCFYDVKTDCSSGFQKGLKFESWNIEENRWQRESESIESKEEQSLTKWTTIVLVLDKTTSLGSSGLDSVKYAATSFLQEILTQTKGVGNVHVGILAFAGNYEVFPITSLTNSSYYSLVNFIQKQQAQDNTYLYYAMDKAISLIESYSPSSQYQKKDFQGASIVTFTDGKDNGSESDDAKYFKDDYRLYLINKRLSKQINGKPIQSYIMSYKGKDVSNSDITKLKSLATPDKFFPVGNFSALRATFVKIAKSLKVNWSNLICYVPQVTGRVRWVLDCDDPKPTPPVRYTPSFVHELGGIVGGNNGLTYKIWNTDNNFACQLDIAYNVLYRSMDLQSNFMYQNYIKDWDSGGLLWYGGGGTSFGISTESGFIWGLNGIIGLEWMFYNFPLSLSFDYRPGIGISSNFLAKGLDFSLGVRWYLER